MDVKLIYKLYPIPYLPPPQIQHIECDLKSSSSYFPHPAALLYALQLSPSLSVLSPLVFQHFPMTKLSCLHLEQLVVIVEIYDMFSLLPSLPPPQMQHISLDVKSSSSNFPQSAGTASYALHPCPSLPVLSTLVL